MRKTGKWELAPAYDLNGGAPPEADAALDPWSGWHNQHAIKVNGKRSDITDEDLLVVADRFAIGTGKKVLEQVKDVLERQGE